MTGHSLLVTSLRRHVKEGETPVPVYVGLKLYASLRTKTVIQHCILIGFSFHMIGFFQSATISVWICWESTILNVYLLLKPWAFTLEAITIIAKGNINVNAISTRVKKHFRGISMTTILFPPKENQGVKQNVFYDLILLDRSKKLALHEGYEIIGGPPYRKNTPLSLPMCTINRIFELSVHIV